MKPKLIVISHGKMAEETLRSAEMIVGPIENGHAVSMLADDGAEGLKRKLDALVPSLGDGPIIILADLYGGTPCNVATGLAQTYANITLVAGLTLGMVIEYGISLTEDPDILASELVESSKAGLLQVKFESFDSEDDEEIEIE